MAQRVLLSEHARRQAARRSIPESTVMDIAVAPEQVIAVRVGREVRQSRVTLPDGRSHLVRIVADTVGHDIRVVTVYRTSKVAKYWRAP
jgi:hypothetical protein